ncbi:DUF418 domain-containing protein [Bacillus sp. P14.5]|uniref:DUF418 domain-containing protein n=1 Tax=Bacillus sp. P14.5 TaxID=1983400 RepID=UPI000DEAE321|nr:DUF418 domain-containing protein [Bacillus sp. P14.5]
MTEEYQETGIRKRKLAPDLARGFMLLFISFAHAHVFLYSSDGSYTDLDQFIVLVRQIVIDGRAFPMFFLLFGYGMVQFMRSQEKKGSSWPYIGELFHRRGWCMLFIGLLHAVILFDDIIGMYGLATLLFFPLLRFTDKNLLWISGLFYLLIILTGAITARGFDPFSESTISSSAVQISVIAASAVRTSEWIVYTPLLVYQVVPGMLIGIWAARKQILDFPVNHRPLLVRISLIGIGAAVIGGIPLAMASSQYWPDVSAEMLTASKIIHTATGYLGGIGWAALIGLASIPLEKSRSTLIMAIAAAGQRSMTFYIFQSVIFVAFFSPYAGGFGNKMGQFGSDVTALVTWLASILIADVMRRLHLPGPAEYFLRRVTYNRSTH